MKKKAIKIPHSFMPSGMADGAYLSMYCIHCGRGWTKNYEQAPIEECPAFKKYIVLLREDNAKS